VARPALVLQSIPDWIVYTFDYELRYGSPVPTVIDTDAPKCATPTAKFTAERKRVRDA
jgi:hypothetical protein